MMGNNNNRTIKLVLLFSLFLVSLSIEAAKLADMLKGAVNQGLRQPNSSSSGNRNGVQARQNQNNSQQSAIDTSPYSGPARWDIDDRTIEKIADAPVKEALAVEGRYNQKYVQQDFKEFVSKWQLSNSSNKEGNFWKLKAQGPIPPVKAALIECEYLEPKEPLIESGSKLPQNIAVKITFWQVGARVTLPSDYYREQGWDGYADAEMSSCPNDLASAMETGFGAEVWSLKKLQYNEAVQQKVTYHTKNLPKLEEDFRKPSKPRSSGW